MTRSTLLRPKPGKAPTMKDRQAQIEAMLDRFLPKAPSLHQRLGQGRSPAAVLHWPIAAGPRDAREQT